MTDVDARTRRGAHRTRREPMRVVVPLALAFLLVVGVVTAYALQDGPETVRTNAPVGTSSPRTATRPATRPPTTPGTTPTTAAPSRTPSPSGSAAPGDPQAYDIEVVVLNGTGRVGLGGRAAELLREGGWDVPVIGNFRGEMPATTVLYPDGERAAAQALASALPGQPRVAERFGNLSRTRLTVVIGDDYPR